MSLAFELARWAHNYQPGDSDLQLAQKSLLDTMAVTLAARGHPIVALGQDLSRAARFASIAHVLDFDDLHMESTAHISAVCVPATLATGGDARAYLAGAGVMARVGIALGWQHYEAGWHITCSAGAPGAAASAAVALGLDLDQTAAAIALSISSAGGVQRAFGFDSKALQVGFATEAGVRAAQLVREGATANPDAFDQWLGLLGGDSTALSVASPAVPGGLATKIYPCCYALQRPIAAVQQMLGDRLHSSQIDRIEIRTPESTVVPLNQHRPLTGLQAKFSLEYGLATAILDPIVGFEAFSDVAVRRPEAKRLVEVVDAQFSPGGTGLLDGSVEILVTYRDGRQERATMSRPPGAPGNAQSPEDLTAKLRACGPDVAGMLSDLDWDRAAQILNAAFPAANNEPRRSSAVQPSISQCS